MENNNGKVLNYSISKYLDFYYKKKKNEKIAIYITAKQTVYMLGNEYIHFEKVIAMSKALFPYRGYNQENFYEGAVSIYSVGPYLTIYIPDVIDPIQYECLSEILDEIIKYEDEEQIRILVEGKDYYMNEARSKLGPNIEEDEVLITEPIPYEEFGLKTEMIFGRPHNMMNYHHEEESHLGG